jgi:4-hydroxybenzoate polyprenyltransferase
MTLPGNNNITHVPLIEKMKFAFWGIRYFDIIIIMAYPTMGAVFAVDDIDLSIIIKFVIFSFFNFIFVAHIYIFNDWSDAHLNPEEPKRRLKHALKYPVLTMNQVLVCSIAMSLFALTGFAFLSWRLFVVGIFIEVITASYSHPVFNLKGRPFFSTIIHFLGAVLYFIGGWSVFRPFTINGFALAVFFGLVLAAGHFSNEIDDFSQDFEAGIRTNAIAFGQRVVFRTGLALFLISSAWLILLSILFFGYPVSFMLAASGVVLLITWTVQTYRFLKWKGGSPIKDFRKFYRLIYALLCAFLFLFQIFIWYF